jgi:hypothetical protein
MGHTQTTRRDPELTRLRKLGFETIEGAEHAGTAFLLMEREEDHECIVLRSTLKREGWVQIQAGPAKRLNRAWLELIGDRAPLDLVENKPAIPMTRAQEVARA